jgi:hypothetical protein
VSEPDRCAERSLARDEPMSGTASTVRSWLLLEDPGPWGVDALRDARLPDGLGESLRRRSSAAGVRVLLIRRPGARALTGSPAGAPPGAYAIRSGPGEPWIESLPLGRREDAGRIDLERLGRGERVGGEPVAGPIFLVCTHGRRDPCCAERGRPLAAALAAAFPEATWESSHLGGDRFAGNVLVFPHGFVFGRVEPEAGPGVARAYLDGRLDLGRLRGRTCRPMPIQAAEHLLRLRLGLVGIGDVQLERAHRAADELAARFLTPAGRFEVRVAVDVAGPFALTCHSGRDEAPPAYRVLEISPL